MQALRTGRVNHAYLFSGPRGCGKTTSRAHPGPLPELRDRAPPPEPCGACDSCVALARGGSGTVDVIEIDAASHGGVDDARDLRERASYGPAQSRYKIYIIDEAHMVTPQGFNALLKIVEEPPEHVKFVFATTEPEKVIGTIRSRTHHYPFRLVPPGPAAGLHGGALRQGGRRGGARRCCRSSCARAVGRCATRCRVLDQLIAGSGRRGPHLRVGRGAARLHRRRAARRRDRRASPPATPPRCSAPSTGSSRPGSTRGASSRTCSSGCATSSSSAALPDGAGAGAAARARGPARADAAARRPRSARARCSRAADVVNAGLTEMTGATAPRLQLELIAARILLPGAAGEAGYAARLDRLERRLDVGGVPTAAVSYAAPSPPAAAPPPAAPPRPPRPAASRGSAAAAAAPPERRPCRPRSSRRRPPRPRVRRRPSPSRRPTTTPRPSTTPRAMPRLRRAPASAATACAGTGAGRGIRRPSRAPVAHPGGPAASTPTRCAARGPTCSSGSAATSGSPGPSSRRTPRSSTTTASGCCSASPPSGSPRPSGAAPTPTTCARR